VEGKSFSLVAALKKSLKGSVLLEKDGYAKRVENYSSLLSEKGMGRMLEVPTPRNKRNPLRGETFAELEGRGGKPIY